MSEFEYHEHRTNGLQESLSYYSERGWRVADMERSTTFDGWWWILFERPLSKGQPDTTEGR